MKVIYGIENVSIKEKCAVCIGNFDGLHLGHRLIIYQIYHILRPLNIYNII